MTEPHTTYYAILGIMSKLPDEQRNAIKDRIKRLVAIASEDPRHAAAVLHIAATEILLDAIDKPTSAS